MVYGVYLNTIGSLTSDDLAYGTPSSSLMIGGYDLSYSYSPDSLF